MSVATAASMDGYTAYGASITHLGSKQTFDCPAPLVVVADLDVIAGAPPAMKAWGYADLLAKVTAGATGSWPMQSGWSESIRFIWSIVSRKTSRFARPAEKIRANDFEALGKLVEGLMLGGFAMQAMRSSRPASVPNISLVIFGISNITFTRDMRRRMERKSESVRSRSLRSTKDYSATKYSPSIRGGCGTMAVPTSMDRSREAVLFNDEELRAVAVREIDAKYIDPADLLTQLQRIHRNGQPCAHASRTSSSSWLTFESCCRRSARQSIRWKSVFRTIVASIFLSAFFIRRRFHHS